MPVYSQISPDTLESYALIDLDAISHNYFAIKKWTGVDVLPVLKANAYGHGLEQVASHLFDLGARNFAVANLIEAKQLKSALPACNVLIFGNVNPMSLSTAIDEGMCLTVFSKEYWQNLQPLLNKKINVQLKINTGFNRLGFDINCESIDIIRQMHDHPYINIQGIYSHLRLTSKQGDVEQYEKFRGFLEKLDIRGIIYGKGHIADSISAIDYDWCRMDMVRIGAALFGLRNDRSSYDKIGLKPALKIYSSVSQIRTVPSCSGIGYDEGLILSKDTKIATIAFGYADGLPRQFSKSGQVCFGDQTADIVSAICMDQCMVDISNIENAKANDKVLIMDSDYNSPCSISNIAKICNTNQNSIVSGIVARLQRVYIKQK